MKFNKPENTGGKNFLKLKSGDKVKGILRGDPYEFRVHWADNRSSVCVGLDKCELCKAGSKSKFRFRLNFIVREGEAYVPKILEQGWATYELLESLHNGHYDLEKTVVEISRHGEGLNTSYTVIPVPPPHGQVTAELEKKLALVSLLDLKNVEEVDVSAPSFSDEIPF